MNKQMVYGLIIGLVVGGVFVWVIMATGIGTTGTFIGQESSTITTTVPVTEYDVPWNENEWTGIEWAKEYENDKLMLTFVDAKKSNSDKLEAEFIIQDQKGNVYARTDANLGTNLKSALKDENGQSLMESDLVVRSIITDFDNNGNIVKGRAVVIFEDPYNTLENPTISTDISSLGNQAYIYATNNKNGGPN
ncbi:hypothetical protein ACFL0Z_03005 [Patescibacteria group bacterium]